MKRALKQRTVREKDILKACTDLLDAERVPWYRMNSGKIILKNGNGTRRCIKLNPEGTPDLLFHLHGISMKDSEGAVLTTWHTVMWIEVKRPGEYASQAQWDFRLKAHARGENWLLIDDVKQLQDCLKEMRK